MGVDVLIRALVDVLHQVLLKQEGVVSSHGAGVVVELLVVVANVCLPLGGEEFIHVHLVTQRHHEHDAWGGTHSTHPTSHHRQHLTLQRDGQPAGSRQLQGEGFPLLTFRAQGQETSLARQGSFLKPSLAKCMISVISADCLH